MSQPTDIDRLIELGLNRYGAGDLEGALLMWEEALAVDPFNAQANSYVDYVRMNYDLLTSGEPSVEDVPPAPFAIEEEPEYLIEIVPERPSLPLAASIVALDLDDGWDSEETHDASAAAPAAGETNAAADAADPLAEPPALELELEAEPPPLNFEDATREYHGAAQKAAEPVIPRPGELSTTAPTHSEFAQDDFTGGFNSSPGTPIGFAMQETEVRKRDFGFVQPTHRAPAAPAAPPVTIPSTASTGDGELELELGHYDATQERAPRYESHAEAAGEATADDLIDSLPTPRPAGRQLESGEILLPSKSSTRDLPHVARQPARNDSSAHSQAEVLLAHAPTRELSAGELRDRALAPMINAPTRELGLRPGGRPSSSPGEDEDIPTGQSDARAIREAAARNEGRASQPGTERTKHDIVLPFDPIAAQAAQILDDVDASAVDGESHEDRTRRRITRLLELAADWNEAGELDKAVSAVDLALSEDPNSALGQKLITRNKDTIMSLFQAYLGDLDRMPALAKPLHELANAPISPRAAFLLSRIDGMITIDELLDVSGMPRLEAYRHLCQLYLRGILR